MGVSASPTVLLLDGDHDTAPQIAKELSRDLDCHVVGVGTSSFSRLFYSRYCDEGVVLPEPGSPRYAPSIRSLVERLRPDVVLPVGYGSTVGVDAVRDRIPDEVAVALPPATSLDTALDKGRTLSLARRRGVAVPEEYTEAVADLDDAARDPSALADLPFPLFLKARRETGETTTANVTSPASFWRTYDDLRESCGEEILVQEPVDVEGPTYGCGVLFTGDGPALTFSHVEHRSIPRRGGTGTRLQAIEDPVLESRTVDLLEALDWYGVALAEYKRVDGRYVLMEVNPKFWASYPLASQCGFRFASTLVADLLDLPTPESPSRAVGERVFPLRELAFSVGDDDESVLQAAAAMAWPPARPAFNVDDPFAWLVPPADVVSDAPRAGAVLKTFARTHPLIPSPGDVSRIDPGSPRPG